MAELTQLNSADFLAKVKALKSDKPNWQEAKTFTRPVNAEKALQSITNQKASDELREAWEKAIGAPDMTVLRLTAQNDVVDQFRNEETIFLSHLETKPIFRTHDLQIEWREEHIGDDVAEDINLNVDAFASESASFRAARTNTVGFQGTKTRVRILAQALGEQSPIERVDETARQQIDAMMRIRKLQERESLVSTEQVLEGEVIAPKFRGCITDSTLYNQSMTGDFTNAIIQARVDAIANTADLTEGLGYVLASVAFCPAAQLPKIRDLMTARYPGEASTDALAYADRLLSIFGNIKSAQPHAVVAYQPMPGRPVLFLYNPAMPANTTWFFDPDGDQQLARFQIMGSLGPWSLERPTETLSTILYNFDGISIRHNRRDAHSVLNMS